MSTFTGESFRVEFSGSELDDLRQRLDRARVPQALGPGGGIGVDRVRALLDRWRAFDWGACDALLNRHPQFVANAGGSRLHYVHAPHAGAPAVLLLHGWPGSFLEMVDVVPLLRGELSAVVPSIPGFGHSQMRPSMTPADMADALAALMSALGHERFLVQGGDIGAGIGTWLARRHPERVAGLHLNYVPGSYAPHAEGPLAPEEERFLADARRWSEQSGAYAHLQRTRPLTLAYGLEDSPVALLAWIAEKFDDWADPASPVPDDVILANVSLYWFTRTAHSSVRYYLESARAPHAFAAGERVRVPCAIARFPLEEPFPPRRYIERGYDVRRYTELPRGGHFAALEQPKLLADDLAAFAATLPG